MSPEISPAPMISPEIERRQTTAVTTQTLVSTVIVPSPETDTTEIAQFHASPTFVTTVILVPAHHFPNTTAQEMTPTPIVKRRHHINPIAINLDPHLSTDMIPGLLIVVVRTTTAIELPPKTANPTPETTTIAIAVMSPCLQTLPLRHPFSPKILMPAIDAQSFKSK